MAIAITGSRHISCGQMKHTSHVMGSSSSHNSHMWPESNPHAFCLQRPLSVNVWTGIVGIRKSWSYLLRERLIKKMRHSCLVFLHRVLTYFLDIPLGAIYGIWFQYRRALMHFISPVRDCWIEDGASSFMGTKSDNFKYFIYIHY